MSTPNQSQLIPQGEPYTVKFHLSKSIILGLKFLDKNQNKFLKKNSNFLDKNSKYLYQINNLLDLIEQYPDIFLQDEDENDYSDNDDDNDDDMNNYKKKKICDKRDRNTENSHQETHENTQNNPETDKNTQNIENNPETDKNIAISTPPITTSTTTTIPQIPFLANAYDENTKTHVHHGALTTNSSTLIQKSSSSSTSSSLHLPQKNCDNLTTPTTTTKPSTIPTTTTKPSTIPTTTTKPSTIPTTTTVLTHHQNCSHTTLIPIPLPCVGFITYSQIHSLSIILKFLDYPTPYISQLVQNTTLCQHIVKESIYTPEFAAHLAFLRSKQAKEALALAIADAHDMANGGNGRNIQSKALGSETDNSKGTLSKNLQQIGAPIHFVAVSGTCSFVFWWIGTVIFRHNKGLQWACCIIGMLCGFILETSLFVLRDWKESQTELSKKKALERKEEIIKAQIQQTLFPRGRTSGGGSGSGTTATIGSATSTTTTTVIKNTLATTPVTAGMVTTPVKKNETKKER